ncbi:MAG TPA: CHAP domain-containing protein, partial [Isosphaeraceae bacterium]|nr:CHAP domain-containing protein [Isosphaeraceae bacterium]
PTPTPPPPPQVPVVNQQVLAFAEAHVGQEVGGGQCTDLVDAAYAAAGAESESLLGPTGPNANYVWGTLVDTVTTANHSLAGVLPGDVIQFSNVTIVNTTTYPNGSWTTTTQTADHHTAIVESVSGSTIHVLEQNANSVMTVQHGSYDLDGLQGGTMWIYQPISLS